MRILHCIVGLLPFFASACATTMDLPTDFVQLRDGGQGFRGITSDDARVRVRDLSDDTEASAEFWASTLQNDFVQHRGYELVDSGEVKNRAGESGRWLEFVANVHGESTGYLIALWVHGGHLQVAEFAARIEVFRARVEAVRASLSSVH